MKSESCKNILSCNFSAGTIGGKLGSNGHFIVQPNTGDMPSKLKFAMRCTYQCFKTYGSKCRAVEITSVQNGNYVCAVYSVTANITQKTLLIRAYAAEETSGNLLYQFIFTAKSLCTKNKKTGAPISMKNYKIITVYFPPNLTF